MDAPRAANGRHGATTLRGGLRGWFSCVEPEVLGLESVPKDQPSLCPLAHMAAAPAVPALEYALRNAGDVDAIRDDLKGLGVCVVKIYEENDPIVESYEEGMAALALELRPDRGTAHGARGMGGIVKTYAASCHPTAMSVRLDPRSRGVFAAVYGIPIEDTMVSWDAVGILGVDAQRNDGAPRRVADDPKKRFKASTGSTLDPHVDVGLGSKGAAMQGKMKSLHPSFHACVQSQFVCRSVPPRGATLVVSPGPWYSAEPDASLFDLGNHKDFCRITETGYRHLDGTWRAVEAPRGCLIMWISSLPHTNKFADAGVDPCRLVVFLAWQSRRLITDSERACLKRKKRAMIFSGGTTDHWSTHIPKIHRGSHYSNRHPKTSVLYTSDNPPPYDEQLTLRIEEAM